MSGPGVFPTGTDLRPTETFPVVQRTGIRFFRRYSRTFKLKEGLSWTDSSGRNFAVTELAEWIGERAQAGRLPPKGFPKNNRFG